MTRFDARAATIALLRLWNEFAGLPDFLPDPARLASYVHRDFRLTYNGRTILCGLADLRLHFGDIGRRLGPWTIPLPPAWTVAEDERCVVLYDVVTEPAGAVRCCVLYSFRDGLCSGQDEFVQLPTALDMQSLIRGKA
ncbi:MAG TPA: nuclear transport factor 2 family protein [Acetobacteraceae bacterium]|jgi:hypothetical protein|nr:nuclear transport factor 2 family protein [Acetobacteraceae bacterium]